MTAAQVQKPLGKAGIAFFGSLCAGTFGLGVWQTRRYTEKVELLAQRDRDMALAPSDDVHRAMGRIRIRGTFDHAKEFYVGPRGSPLHQSNGSLGVPQHGYFVFTPLTVQHQQDSSSSLGAAPCEESVLVNRGWVPREKVVGNNRSRRHAPDRGAQQNQASLVGDWDRPRGVVTIMAVQARVEGMPMIRYSPSQIHYLTSHTHEQILAF
jgi:cytochrome oxidase assembly protein ShyY1